MLQDQLLFMKIQKWLYSLITNAFWGSLWLFGLSILIFFLIRWWSGDQLPPVRLMNYLMPWLLCGLLPTIIMARLFHHNWLTVTLAIPTALICLTYAPLFLPRFCDAIADHQPVKIMSYNVWRENQNMTAVAEVILKEQPDIILLQEVQRGRVQALLKALAHLYPDTKPNFTYAPSMLQAVISRYPLTPLRNLPQKAAAQKVLIHLPQNKITVFNVHPQHGRWLRRHNQVKALLEEEISPMNAPVILAGDFNTTEQSQTYKLITEYMNNTHRQAGFGFGFTYPSRIYRFKGRIPLPPLVRIDHIFYNNYFLIHKAATLKESGGSDHLPIVAELFLESAQSTNNQVP